LAEDITVKLALSLITSYNQSFNEIYKVVPAKMISLTCVMPNSDALLADSASKRREIQADRLWCLTRRAVITTGFV